MKRRIELKSIDHGTAIYVNPSHIAMIRPASGEPQDGTVVHLAGGHSVTVEENADQLLEKVDSLDWGRTDSVGAD